MTATAMKMATMKVKESKAPVQEHLYEIVDGLLDVQMALLENYGELTPEIEEAMEHLEMVLPAKVEQTCHVIRRMEQMADTAKKEIARIQDEIVKPREKGVASLKSYLLGQFKRLNEKKVQTALYTVNRVKNSQASVRSMTTNPPEQFSRVVPASVEFDAKAAIEYLKEAKRLPGEPGNTSSSISGSWSRSGSTCGLSSHEQRTGSASQVIGRGQAERHPNPSAASTAWGGAAVLSALGTRPLLRDSTGTTGLRTPAIPAHRGGGANGQPRSPGGFQFTS